MTYVAIFRWLWDRRAWTLPALTLAAGVGIGWKLHKPPPAPAVAIVATEHKAVEADTQKDTATSVGWEKITTTDYDVGGYAPPVMPVTADHGNSDSSHDADTAFCRPIVVPGEDRIIRQTVLERGPTTIIERANTETQLVDDKKIDLTIAPPAAAPFLELQLGVEDVLDGRTLRAAARVRVSEHLWLEGSLKPADWLHGKHSFGVGIARSF